MSLVELLASPVGRLLMIALVHFLWQGLAVAAALITIVELLRVRRAEVRYACSLAALVLMTLCPLITLAWLGSRNSDAMLALEMTNSSRLGALFSVSLEANENRANFALGRWLQAAQPYLLAIWLSGVVAFGARLIAGAIGVLGLRRSRQALPLKMAEIVEQLGRQMQMKALPLVFLSRQVAEAMAVGVVRPLVLIPAAWATEMPLEMLEAVIAHELAHLRRRDLWINLLQRIVETLLFYHPAVWWLSWRLRIERELCADELAVAATGKRLVYAQTLEQVAHWRRAEVRPVLAAFLRGEQDMRLLERVRNVLGPAGGERSRLWPAGVLALALPIGLWAGSLGLVGPLSRLATADEKPKVKIVRDVEFKLVDESDDRPARRRSSDREGRKESVERKVIRKEAEAEEKAEVKTRRGEGDARIDELTALVKRLVERVEKLQAELNELRGDKQRPADGEAEVEIRQRKRYRELSDQQARLAEEKIAAQDKQAISRARKQAEAQKREAIERELAATERAAIEKKRAMEREVEATERAAIEKKRAVERKIKDLEDDDVAAENIKRKVEELADLKKLEALKALNIDKAFIDKVQAQAAEAAKQAANAGEIAAAAKAQALNAVKRALAEKKIVEIEKQDAENKKPPKKKPADDNDET